MAQTSYEDRPADSPVQGDATPKISGQRARQGQNIKGMVAVLVVGALLVVGAYTVMLALLVQPSSVVNESRNASAATVQDQPPRPPPKETAGSPN